MVSPGSKFKILEHVRDYSSLRDSFHPFCDHYMDLIHRSSAAVWTWLFDVKPSPAFHDDVVRVLLHTLDEHFARYKNFLVQPDVYRDSGTAHPIPSICPCIYT